MLQLHQIQSARRGDLLRGRPDDPAPLADVDLAYEELGETAYAEEERDLYAQRRAMEAVTGSHMAVQCTDPQTLAYALNDSPLGLAAWILARSGANMSSVILPSSLPFCGCFLYLATGHRQGRAAIGATGAMSWPSQHSETD